MTMAVPPATYRYLSIGVVLASVIVARPNTDAQAALAKLTGMTTQETARELQISLLATGPVRYQLQSVQADWVVIDVLGVELGVLPEAIPPAVRMIQRIRVAQFSREVVRVVVELAQPVKFHVTTSPDKKAIIIGIPVDARVTAPWAEHPQAQAGMAPARGQPWTVVPGESIGSVRLGMHIQEVFAVLGPSLRTAPLTEGEVAYLWFMPPENIGPGAWATKGGSVYRAWVQNDARYGTAEQVRIGSAEAEVRAVYGEPSWAVTVESQEKKKTLAYESLGMWFSIHLNGRSKLSNAVFEIGVMQPK